MIFYCNTESWHLNPKAGFLLGTYYTFVLKCDKKNDNSFNVPDYLELTSIQGQMQHITKSSNKMNIYIIHILMACKNEK